MKWLRLSLLVTLSFCSGESWSVPTASVSGQVIDAETKRPIADVQVTLVDSLPSQNDTDVDGYFWFDRIAPGKYTFRFVCVGYETLEQKIAVDAKPTVMTIKLDILYQLEEIVVKAGIRPSDDELAQFEKTTDLVLSKQQLGQQMGMTIADTLSEEVGIAQQTMGRAAARPVLRGMGGDRVLILEDGARTGDKSASSADHAVAIDPTTARNIQITRGPASLIYGSNTLGGVVNVKRLTIPESLPNHPTVNLTFQSESVNSGITGMTGLTLPLGDLAWRIQWNRRYASNTQTPVGILENTSLSNVNFSTGASVVKDWGHIGISGGRYRSDYGIPGSPEGHVKGVSIALDRQRYEGNLEYAFNEGANISVRPYFLEKLKLDTTITRYQHQELESNGALGVEFGVLTYNVSVRAHLRGNAIAGLWGE